MTDQQAKPVKRLIRLKEVVERTSLSKTSIYELMKSGEFPRQFTSVVSQLHGSKMKLTSSLTL